MNKVNLSTLTQSDPAFTNLRNVNIAYCEFDIGKVLTRCSNTVKKLKLNSRRDFMFDLLVVEFKRLKHLIFAGHEENLFNLISKVARCLDRLGICG